MRNLRLRKWVKVSLGILVIIGVISFANSFTNSNINKCVSAGNSQNYCERGLK